MSHHHTCLHCDSRDSCLVVADDGLHVYEIESGIVVWAYLKASQAAAGWVPMVPPAVWSPVSRNVPCPHVPFYCQWCWCNCDCGCCCCCCVAAAAPALVAVVIASMTATHLSSVRPHIFENARSMEGDAQKEVADLKRMEAARD